MAERDDMDWHRLFSLILEDFFIGSPFEVDSEIDLSKKLQRLDIAVIRKREGEFVGRLPDGFDDLVEFNLVSFKSYQEALDDWTIDELLGHFVNYRKQISPSMNDLLPLEQFHLYGVCARFPTGLNSKVKLNRLRDGVYECLWGTRTIRIIVIKDLPLAQQNAMFQFFSAVPAQVQYAQEHYHQRNRDTSRTLDLLIYRYTEEGIPMPYRIADLARDYKKELLDSMTMEERLAGASPEEILKHMPPEERLKGLPPEERLKGLPPEERLKGLPPEERLKGLLPEERLKGLTAAELEAYLAKIRSETVAE